MGVANGLQMLRLQRRLRRPLLQAQVLCVIESQLVVQPWTASACIDGSTAAAAHSAYLPPSHSRSISTIAGSTTLKHSLAPDGHATTCWAPSHRGTSGASWASSVGPQAHARGQSHWSSMLPCQPAYCWRTLHQQPEQRQQEQQGPHNKAPSSSETEPVQSTHAQPAIGSSWLSLPNLLSLSRVATAPVICYQIYTAQWAPAVVLLAAAGATDWADGFLARRMGHTSKLGSYLDPLCDKVLVCAVMGTLGYLHIIPAWLALLVIGRDTALVGGMFVYRFRSFGWLWPGRAAFFDVDAVVGDSTQQTGARAGAAADVETTWDAGSRGGDAGAAAGPGAAVSGSKRQLLAHAPEQQQQTQQQGQQMPQKAGAGGGLPSMRPLMISKFNTVLQLALVGACITHQWQGVPDQEVLKLLEHLTAGTTGLSGVLYGWQYVQGRLLPRNQQ